MKILIYPYDKNPYQRLLYKPMVLAHKDIKITYMWFLPIVGALHVPGELILRRLFGYKIIHIHWIAFYIRQNIPYHRTISWHLTKYNIWLMKILGYKVVWTVHDILPHQLETIDDLYISRYLANKCNMKIVHSRHTIEQMKEKGLNIQNCKVIPHGNYEKIYNSDINVSQARKRLQIPLNKTVILFFGIIKSYKGVDDLIEAYKTVRTPDTHLVIAGKCGDDSLKLILQNANKMSDISVYDKYIEDTDVSTYFNAADIVCLPFKAITTSGSVLLAITFGKPIIAPRSGSLKDLPEAIGKLYNPDDRNGLKNSIKVLINSKKAIIKATEESKEFNNSLSWKVIADMTYNEYRQL